MNLLIASEDLDANSRWKYWQARGVRGDRRRAVQMGSVSGLIAIGLVIWLLAQMV